MGKRRWIRDRDWQRQPHVKDGPPPSLWWYQRPDHLKVVDAYLEQYSHGRTLPSGFRDQILLCLRDLSDGLYLKNWGRPRTWRYWSIPSYAATHGIKPHTLMKRLRELETVATQLFRDSVPSGRLPREPLSELEVSKIRAAYAAGTPAKDIALLYRIPPSRVGLLCRDLRKNLISS
jgi:hypothetical protein